LPNHKLDPNTVKKRDSFYKKKNYVKSIIKQQNQIRLNGLKIMKSIPRGLEKIERRFKGKRSEIALTQTLFINRQAAHLTDAIIDGKYGIRNFEKKERRERALIWEREFSEVIDHLLNMKEIKNKKDLVNYINNTEKFLSLPKGIFKARERHARAIKKIRNHLIKNKIEPEENLLREINDIVSQRQTGKNMSAKAMKICVAASLYADLREKQGKEWIANYRKGMELVYKQIEEQPELLQAIVNLK
jgi:hypothetical protein